MYFFVFFVLSGIILFPLFYRYILFFNPSLFFVFLFSFFFIGIVFLPFLVNERFEKYLKKYYPLYRSVLYAIYVGCFLLLLLTAVRDIIWISSAFIWKTIPSPFDPEALVYVNGMTLMIIVILTVWSLFQGVKIPAVQRVEIASDKLKNTYKLVVLSDLHLHRSIHLKKISEIIKKVNQLMPDVILLTGDTIDDVPCKISLLIHELKKLKSSKGIYFISGNHEFYIGYTDCVNALKEIGARFLDNQGISLGNDLYLAGISDPEAGLKFNMRYNIENSFKYATKDQFRILMSHTPILFKEKPPFNLEISGHTHGGQIFPFHIGVYLRYKCLSGLYQFCENGWMYISRGSGQWGPQMRLAAPAEITELILTPDCKKGS